MLEIAKFCSMDTLELCGDLLQPGGQLETPDLVLDTFLGCVKSGQVSSGLVRSDQVRSGQVRSVKVRSG